MPYHVDKDRCTKCGMCEGECPVQAIFEDDDSMFIDDNLCIECGACMPVCPENAIVFD